MTKGLNIVSRLTFENIPDGTLPTPIPDENQYSNYSYTKVGTVTVETIDEIKFIKLNSTNAKIYSPLIISDQSKKNFQAEFDVIFDSLKPATHLVSIGVTTLENSLRVVASSNPAQGLRLINSNIQVTSYYRFENNKKYTICVGFKDNVVSMYVDGTIIGYLYSEEFVNSLNVTTPSNIILGAPLNNTNDTNLTLYGKLGNINISIGPSVKHEESYTKYGTNLVSFLNFENLAAMGTYKTGIEAVYNGIEWRGVESATYSNGYGNIKNISTDLTGEFTVMFSLKKFKIANANILKYGNYSVDYVAGFIPVPDPDVIVNDNTTAALNFEDGIVDEIQTTVWTKEGTADVTSANKIFGENSFETKALGDSLSTTSNIITGGSTPFTIEFYALIKGRYGWSDTNNTQYPLISKYLGTTSGTKQQLHMQGGQGNKLNFERQVASGSVLNMGGIHNIKFNEVNKYTLSYDGSAFRVFINDKLDMVGGSNIGLNFSGSEKFNFLNSFASHESSFKMTTKGLIDNINIHDGIATKVRDPDPYEEFLVVDLAFDGENNSTKIVDNGALKSQWTVNGNAKISTDQKFDGFSSLYLDGNGDYIYTNNIDLNLGINDFTISFSCNMQSYENLYQMVITNSIPNKSYICFWGNYTSSPDLARRITLGIALDVYLTSTFEYELNKNYKIDIVRKDQIFYLYIDNKLDTMLHTSENFNLTEDSNSIAIGYRLVTGNNNNNLNGYIKNFKIYKGVAVIPEDPTGKIQLDFDNNVIDKYGNSTWTNNGVTFDQVNSVKGYSAYFDGNALGIKSGINNNLNFENKNFIIDFDFKAIELGRQYSSNIITSTQVGSYTPFSMSIPNGSTSISVSTTNDSMTGWGVSLFSAGTTILTNDYRNICVSRINNIFMLKDNDVVRSIANINTTQSLFNLNGGNATIIGTNRNDLVGTKFKGYIDNFKSTKNTQESVIIDKPAVHLPLETNAINTGFTNLTINSVGSPTYTTVDGKKCIKFEQGKYLTINSNNIFNLGTSSDFYIEFDFMLDDTSTTDRYLLSTVAVWSSSKRITYLFVRNSTNKLVFQTADKSTIEVSLTSNNSLSNDTFYNCKLTRFGNVFKILINNEVWITADNVNLDLSKEGTYIGYTPVDGYLKGYMSNFKMFVGTSEIPETYNDKKVLDLDFKPTGKSYLFKDNNNKCVIHPVNITQRDYQDSQYCCTFNGTNQYLQLGKNELFNMGNDDFIIEIKFTVDSFHSSISKMLLSSGETNGVVGRGLISIEATSASATRPKSLQILTTNSSGSSVGLGSSNDVLLNELNHAIIIRNGSNLTINLNDVITTRNDFNEILNFNLNNNTYIGWRNYSGQIFLNGTIYSIKVLRNTSDLSLLEDENTDVIIGDTTLTLSNGTDSQEVIFDNKAQNDFRFVHSNDSTKLIVNEHILEVPNVENESNELSLFTDFSAEAKDIKTYNIAFEDEDTFSGNVPIHTQFGEIEEINTLSDDFIVVDQGDFIVNGFFEGRPENSRYQIQNRFDKFIVHTGSGPFNYNGLNERFIDDYEIYLPDTKETMPIPTEPMIRGYITISITPTECEGVNFGVKVFRRSDNKLIGIYDFNNYVCTIDNLDCNKRYDCIIFDQDVNLESRCLSNRTPLPY